MLGLVEPADDGVRHLTGVADEAGVDRLQRTDPGRVEVALHHPLAGQQGAVIGGEVVEAGPERPRIPAASFSTAANKE